jgi:hypothetical protein
MQGARTYADYLDAITDAPWCSEVARWSDGAVYLPAGNCKWDIAPVYTLLYGKGIQETTIILPQYESH